MRFGYLLVAWAAGAGAAEVCPAPRLHEGGPLAAAAAQDRLLGQAFSEAARSCGERTEACERARLACSGSVSAVAQRQIGFDEGMWLRDMLLPYLGQPYPLSRRFDAFTLANEASCNVDAVALARAGERRLAQAARREALLEEYGRYARWVEDRLQSCQRGGGGQGPEVKSAAPDGGSGAALAQAKWDAEAQAQVEAMRAQQAAGLEAQASEQRRVEAEARLRQAQWEAEARGRRAREEGMVKAGAKDEVRARELEEAKAVEARSSTAARLRAEKARLVEEAELAYRQAVENEEAKRRAAVEAVSVNPAVAQGAVAEAALAEKAREEAERNVAQARLRADHIEVDDSFERARGHVGALVGGGAMGWRETGVPDGLVGPGVGVMVTAHVGFWGQAPLRGLASGFELALVGELLKPFPAARSPLDLSAHLSARYYFGALGVGVAGEARVADARFGLRPFGAGLTVAVAMVDTPSIRVILAGHWFPVGTEVDLARALGELEVSWRWLTFRVTGGSFTQRLDSSFVGWQAAAFLGARLGW